MKTAVFYHAGCAVCVDAERQVAESLDPNKFKVDVVDLKKDKARIRDAERSGVKSVPALVIDDHPFHINFGAALEDLKVSGAAG
jgi:glutaredoxin